jgi:predicted 3-demethylubiquinone-9 3-methyltransferase (glyoxalase superfamily)
MGEGFNTSASTVPSAVFAHAPLAFGRGWRHAFKGGDGTQGADIMQKIVPCLWFDTQAEEAAKFYTSLFKRSRLGRKAHYGEAGAKVSGQKLGSVMTIEFELDGQTITGLNGGPHFKFTPASSFFVWCESDEEIETLWQSLSKGGQPRMGLDKYPWAQKYGWTADRFGVEWQMILSSNKQKLTPAFLFVEELFGKGEEAVHYYTSLFKGSKIETMTKDPSMFCVFSLAGQNFALMEGQGKHGFTFSSAFSLMVNCENQAEIDEFHAKLSAGGSIEPCGWVKDKYGVSWQIVPTALADMMADPKKAESVMKALIEMKKPDLARIEQAYRKG